MFELFCSEMCNLYFWNARYRKSWWHWVADTVLNSCSPSVGKPLPVIQKYIYDLVLANQSAWPVQWLVQQWHVTWSGPRRIFLKQSRQKHTLYRELLSFWDRNCITLRRDQAWERSHFMERWAKTQWQISEIAGVPWMERLLHLGLFSYMSL